MLAEGLFEVVHKANANQRFVRVYQSVMPSEPFYVFLAMPSTHAASEAEYREVRRHLLSEYLLVCKHLHPKATDIVGIAISAASEVSCSEDLMYLDARNWTAELAEAAAIAQAELGLLKNVIPIRGTYSEYPNAPPNPTAKISMSGKSRNRLCPCGNGQKFKRCCGR